MALQFVAEEWDADGEVFALPPLGRAQDGRLLLKTTTLFAEIVKRKLSGDNALALAAAFHATLAEMIASACIAAREKNWCFDRCAFRRRVSECIASTARRAQFEQSRLPDVASSADSHK